jgi:type IV pilus assembly protein PilQ
MVGQPRKTLAASKINTVSEIHIDRTQSEQKIWIKTAQKPTFTVFRLNHPFRIVIDVSGGDLSNIQSSEFSNDDLLNNIILRQFNANGFTIGRVMLQFSQEVEYEVEGKGNAVLVRIQTHQGNLPKQVEQTKTTGLNQGLSVPRHRAENIEKAPKSSKATSDIHAQAPQPQTKPTTPLPQKETPPKAKIKLQSSGPNTLNDIKTTGQGYNARIKLLLQKSQTRYSTLKLDQPPRFVLDIDDTKNKMKTKRIPIKHPLIKSIRLGSHKKHTRIVLDLTSSKTEAKVEEVSTGLDISVQRFKPKAKAKNVLPQIEANPKAQRKKEFIATANKKEKTKKKQKTGAKQAAQTPKLSEKNPSQPKVLEKAILKSIAIEDIRFTRDGDLARIVIAIPEEVETKIDKLSSETWLLELKNVTIPQDLERSLDTSAYKTSVQLLAAYQASTSPAIVNIVASLQNPEKYKLYRVGKLLIWEISAQKQAKEILTLAQTPQTAGFVTQANTLARDTAPKQTRKKRISLDLKDADIKNVLRLLAEVSGENIVTSEAVTGTISMRLRNVPWEQALDTILKTKGYDRVRENNIMRIAPSSEIQREKEQELARKKAAEQVEETLIKMIAVNYAKAADVSSHITPLLSSRGSAQVDARTNTIILEDVRSNIERVIELVKHLDRQTPQVLIEARIVEARTSFVRELGIQWGGTAQATAATGNPTGLRFPGDIIMSGAADAGGSTIGTGSPGRWAVNMPAPIGVGVGGGLGFIFSSANGNEILNLRLSAMEATGSGRLISSPRITTMDNTAASISQGVSIPVSVVSAAGANTRFVSAVLQLSVTPHVTNDGSILMDINTNKSEPNFGVRGASGDPTIETKSAQTQVLIGDGDTTVIGGIYTRSTSKSLASVPFLARIPILGWLFKQGRKEDNRGELLIFITPRILNRSESLIIPEELAMDTSPYKSPNF